MSNIKNMKKNHKNNKLKAFIANLKSKGFDVCGCKDCRFLRRDLMNLSFKIAKQYNFSKGYTKSEINEWIYGLAVDIGCSLLNPQYLMDMAKWNEETKHLEESEETRIMLIIHDLICRGATLLNGSERKHFGEAVECIQSFFECPHCREEREKAA